VDDPTRRQPDITLARRLLDWQPRTGLEAGLQATIAWFRREMAWQAPKPAANDDASRLVELRGAAARRR
jgi:UDP-glucuronate decarboxylase